MNITEEEMQTSVWSMLCSWRVCKETCFKRGRVFQPKSAVCSVLTQLDKLKLKDSTAVFCFFLLNVCARVPIFFNHFLVPPALSQHRDVRVCCFPLRWGLWPPFIQAQNSCHTAGKGPARWFIIVNTAHYLVWSDFLYLSSFHCIWVLHWSWTFMWIKSVQMFPHQFGISFFLNLDIFLCRICT